MCFKAIASIFGLKKPKLPAPVIPAPPAPEARQDTGAIIKIGTDSVANERVSGNGSRGGGSRTAPSALGGLGKASAGLGIVRR